MVICSRVGVAHFVTLTGCERFRRFIEVYRWQKLNFAEHIDLAFLLRSIVFALGVMAEVCAAVDIVRFRFFFSTFIVI